ncbi:MAG: hypothetical protein NTV22_11435 [bacterium]|nr:hypothetical protein [bacterium]
MLPINTGKALTPLALSDLIKMHRYLFSTRDAALKLVSDLRSAKTKIDGYFERAKDDRGNFAQIRRQAIESTIPEGFDLSLPIVRGQNPIDVHVEIAINPDTLECTLLAPDLTEKQRVLREELISEELEAIGNLLVIIEV